MFPIFKKLIKLKEVKEDKLFEDVQHLSTLSDEISKKNKSMEAMEFSLLTRQKDVTYISLADFLEMIDDPELSMAKVISKCKHVGQLLRDGRLSKDVSVVEMYSIVEEDHIVLCNDVTTCEKHKDYSGDKIRILTARRIP